MDQIVFWQTCVSPHMTNLAVGLAQLGVNVTYIAGHVISKERENTGWKRYEIPGINVVIIEEEIVNLGDLAQSFPEDTAHLVQGIRGNDYIGAVIGELRRRDAHWGAILETIDERSPNWPLKRLVYRSQLSRWGMQPDFVLAIGAKTPDWVVARGFPADRTFPFSYFIPVPPVEKRKTNDPQGPFRIGFIGQLIARKRPDLLIDALASLSDHEFQLVIAGDGPLLKQLKQKAIEKLGDEKPSMLGRLPMNEVASVVASLDCLVLPSDHDGWGVVVTEALMAGVPVICSDACGAAEAVIASGVGGVFPKGNVEALSSLLGKMLDGDLVEHTKKNALAEWAKCLSGPSGAVYLKKIIDHCYQGVDKPVPPWEKSWS